MFLLAAIAPAAADLRSTFPGRRIGGGTRGECSARLLAHLVPASSVYAPDASGRLAVLVGEGNVQATLVSSLSAYEVGQGQTGPEIVKRFLVVGPGIYLFSAAQLAQPVKWESHYECGPVLPNPEPADAGFQLDFVGQHSPPAISLLLEPSTAADVSIQASLKQFAQSCGKEIGLEEVVAVMGLDMKDISAQVPKRVAVYCL